MKSKTPNKKDPITDIILNRIQSSIPYNQRKKLTCDQCLTKKNNNNKSQTNINQKQSLNYCQIEPLSINYQGKHEILRQDHFEVVQKLLFLIKAREQFVDEIKKSIYQIENIMRNNHDIINNILQQQNQEWLEAVQQQNEIVIANCVALKQNLFLNDQEMQQRNNIEIMQNEQERTIQRLKIKNQHQNVLLAKIQQSVNEPMLGMAGLLNSVGQLKERIEELRNELDQKDKQIQKQQIEVQYLHSLLDRIINILKQYPTLFREQTTNNNILNIREFQYDIEILYLRYSEQKQRNKAAETLQEKYDELYHQLENERANKQQQIQPLVKDPRLRTLIEDLSRLILSKDPNAMSYDLRELIKEIYLQNHADIIKNQEQEIERLKDENQQLIFRQSLVQQPPYFKEEEYTNSLCAQAKTLEQLLNI